MNLLKTISMKLTVNLVNMFFHVDEDGAAFPLYTEAVKFIAHKCAPCSASPVCVIFFQRASAKRDCRSSLWHARAGEDAGTSAAMPV